MYESGKNVKSSPHFHIVVVHIRTLVRNYTAYHYSSDLVFNELYCWSDTWWVFIETTITYTGKMFHVVVSRFVLAAPTATTVMHWIFRGGLVLYRCPQIKDITTLRTSSVHIRLSSTLMLYPTATNT